MPRVDSTLAPYPRGELPAETRKADTDYGHYIQQINKKYQKIEARYGNDCPATATSAEVANTLASLFGDLGVNQQSVLVCDNNTQWDAAQQLCVPTCF